MYQILFDNKTLEFEDCYMETTFKTLKELIEFLSISRYYIISGNTERVFPLFYHFNNYEFESIQILFMGRKIYDSNNGIVGEYEIDLIGGFEAHGYTKIELFKMFKGCRYEKGKVTAICCEGWHMLQKDKNYEIQLDSNWMDDDLFATVYKPNGDFLCHCNCNHFTLL